MSKRDNRCTKCNAYCCRHIAVHIETPEKAHDYDAIRWYLLHRNVWVSIDFEGNWILEFKTPCRLITSENKCAEYSERPVICREYPPEGHPCEGETDEPSWVHLFTTVKEFEKYLTPVLKLTPGPARSAIRRKALSARPFPGAVARAKKSGGMGLALTLPGQVADLSQSKPLTIAITITDLKKQIKIHDHRKIGAAAPGSALHFYWDCRDSGGAAVPPGKYKVDIDWLCGNLNGTITATAAVTTAQNRH